MPRDPAILIDLDRAARLAIEFAQGIEREEFENDLKTISAVLHQLLVLGEAVKRLSVEFVAAHPQVPWSLIAGMRDVLIHGYDIVDLDEVWRTVAHDLPALRAYIAPMINQGQP